VSKPIFKTSPDQNQSPQQDEHLSQSAGVTENTGEVGTTEYSSTDEVAGLAYQRFVARGGEDGHDVEDWLAAEDELQRLRQTKIGNSAAPESSRPSL
jgi:hypothetical protein